MNRDELLTKLAMELSEWPSPVTCDLLHFHEDYGIHTAAWDDGVVTLKASGNRISINGTDWTSRRSELINRPSWDDAPEWAGWLGQTSSGGWEWYECEPDLGDHCWHHDPGNGSFVQRGAIPAGHDWRQTLEQRPATTSIGASSTACDDQFAPDPDTEERHNCQRCGGSYWSPEHDKCPCVAEVGSGRSDGSTASYYELPPGATELQDLISYRNLNAQDGEMFRAIYRKGRASHSDALRDAKKVLFYAEAEVQRLEAYGE